MAHVRQQLRSAVVSAVTGLAATGSRVDSAPVYPLDLAAGPRLLVTVADEQAAVETLHPQPLLRRAVTLVIEGHASATSGLADTLDTIAAQVEAALGASIAVSGVPVPLAYAGTAVEFATDAERPVGRITLTYTADLFTAANTPEALAQA